VICTGLQLAEKGSEARVWKDAKGATILRIDGTWCREIEHALKTVAFDGLEVCRGRGSFEGLAPFADKIRWLHGPTVESTAGLEKLVHVERITYIGTMHEPPFDYRRLPRLKSLTGNGVDITPEYLNHPAIERLDVEELEVKDLKFLSDAKRLRALRLAASPIATLAGAENLPELRELRLIVAHSLRDVSALRGAPHLEALELDEAHQLVDVSAVHGVTGLRWLFIESDNGTQSDLSWIGTMPRLECAGLWLETKSVDWDVLARHPRIYDIVFYTTRGFSAPSDAELTARLSAGGRSVKSLARFPKARFPGFRVEFAPPLDVKQAKPHYAYQNHLQY
jgi:hypothetical protein